MTASSEQAALKKLGTELQADPGAIMNYPMCERAFGIAVEELWLLPIAGAGWHKEMTLREFVHQFRWL